MPARSVEAQLCWFDAEPLDCRRRYRIKHATQTVLARLGEPDHRIDVETLTRVAMDISGRPFLVFKTTFKRHKVGNFDTELVQEWFQAFAVNAGITLHVETLYGSNDHHIAESCFKGLARALRAAITVDERAKGEVPSTKGSLGN